MAPYAVTTKTLRGTPKAALAALEVYIETIENDKTIHSITVTGDNSFVSFFVIHDIAD
jgi:uncharacterized protein (DUF1684 family)